MGVLARSGEATAAGPATGGGARTGGTFAALRVPVFRLLWTTSLVSNLGTWAQTVAAAWVLTEAHAGPAVVAAIQVAATMPLLLLSLAAGALADAHDRRWLVALGLATQFMAAGLLAVLAWAGPLAPGFVVGLTFVIALGAALAGPAWQAMVGDIVPAPAVPGAVLLNSISFNLARAVGPALGGIGLSLAGPAWVFAANAL